jgi:hypothetical protein
MLLGVRWRRHAHNRILNAISSPVCWKMIAAAGVARLAEEYDRVVARKRWQLVVLAILLIELLWLLAWQLDRSLLLRFAS